ncbi:MAG: hypothetical protein HNEKOMLI_00355 [Sodalis sp. Psp]|nr:hypothetical protein [Sodalis sp. Psp]MCR3756841.1 hypothetical protein [Sodalis sp. Ppy]
METTAKLLNLKLITPSNALHNSLYHLLNTSLLLVLSTGNNYTLSSYNIFLLLRKFNYIERRITHALNMINRLLSNLPDTFRECVAVNLLFASLN